MPWWRHNYVTSHVTKFYFRQLLNFSLNILSFEDKKTDQKPVKMWKILCQKTDKNFLQIILKDEH